ncbi:hypothetical protein AAHO55_10660 [Listeria aquatica]
MLPLLFIVIIGIFFRDIKADVVVLTFISFFIALIIEFIRKRKLKDVLNQSFEFFKGMGQGFTQVVVLVVGGVLFAKGMQTIGVIDMLTQSVQHVQSAEQS